MVAKVKKQTWIGEQEVPYFGQIWTAVSATNPMPILIPCHRVLGRDGKLHGYGGPGGLETKAWLLRLESAWLL